MVGLRSVVVAACIAIAACSGEEVDLGGGRLLADAAVGDGDGGRAWDASFDRWRSSRSGGSAGSGNGSSGGDSSGSGSGGSGSGSGSFDDGWNPDADAGSGPRCDIDGPYCAPGGEVFPDECDAIRAGVFDTTYCPWAEP